MRIEPSDDMKGRTERDAFDLDLPAWVPFLLLALFLILDLVQRVASCATGRYRWATWCRW